MYVNSHVICVSGVLVRIELPFFAVRTLLYHEIIITRGLRSLVEYQCLSWLFNSKANHSILFISSKGRVPTRQPARQREREREMDRDAHKYVGTSPCRLLQLLPKISWSGSAEMKISSDLSPTDFI